MAFSKIIFNGNTLMDVTQDTVDAQYMMTGKTATKADGTKVNGSLVLGTSGLEYEEGTIFFQNSSGNGGTTTDQFIAFSNSHTSLPTWFTVVYASSGYVDARVVSETFVLNEALGFAPIGNSTTYGYVTRRALDSSGNFASLMPISLSYSSIDTTASSINYPRYHATESGITVMASSTYPLWGSYKWVAVWY